MHLMQFSKKKTIVSQIDIYLSLFYLTIPNAKLLVYFGIYGTEKEFYVKKC